MSSLPAPCEPSRRIDVALAVGGPGLLRLLLHAPEAVVVIGKLLHVRKRDLARHHRIVSGHVRLRVVSAMFILDVHAGTKLLQVEPVPIDANLIAYFPRLFGGGTALCSHCDSFRPLRFLSVA